MNTSVKEVQATKGDKPAAKAVDPYAERRVRVGKTKRDIENGQKRKNQENKDSRAMWQKDSKRTAQNFPSAACNGKRNRYQVTGPKGETVFLKDTKKK